MVIYNSFGVSGLVVDSNGRAQTEARVNA